MSDELSDIKARLEALAETWNKPIPHGQGWNTGYCAGMQQARHQLRALLAPAPSAPSSPPKCEDCAHCGGMCAHPGCEVGGDLCTSYKRRYDHCVLERTDVGVCGPAGRLFVKKGGA